jgi:hypothetical protein
MNNVARSISIGFFAIMLLSFMISCAHAKTFRGKVIDADTKEPIEGAVVVASWTEETTTPTATHSRLKDVREVLTDKNGEWSISGPKGRANELIPGLSLFIPYTKEPQFTIFKPGYCPWPLGFYIDACKEKIKPEGNGRVREGATIELPKLTKTQDRWRAEGVGSDFMTEMLGDKQKARKMKNFLRLLNEERRFLGLSEYPIWKELENEK